MQLRRTRPSRPMISLVSMIDVLMIMLVFFMVTSTFLNLDMIPMAESSDKPQNTVSTTNDIPTASTILVRLGADGTAFVRGQPVNPAVLTDIVAARLTSNPGTSVMVLPSAYASTQALVSLMDVLTKAGVDKLQVIQLAAQQ